MLNSQTPQRNTNGKADRQASFTNFLPQNVPVKKFRSIFGDGMDKIYLLHFAIHLNFELSQGNAVMWLKILRAFCWEFSYLF